MELRRVLRVSSRPGIIQLANDGVYFLAKLSLKRIKTLTVHEVRAAASVTRCPAVLCTVKLWQAGSRAEATGADPHSRHGAFRDSSETSPHKTHFSSHRIKVLRDTVVTVTIERSVSIKLSCIYSG